MKSTTIAFLILSSVAVPAAAQSSAATLWLSSQSNKSNSTFDNQPDAVGHFDTGSGFGLSVSHRFTDRISGEVALFRTSSDGSVRSEGTTASLGSIDLMPLTAMVQVHFLPGRPFDVYASGGFAYVMADDLDSADLRALGLAPVRLKDKTAATFGGGVTYDFSPRWGVALDARYIPFRLSGRPAGTSDSVSATLNPVIWSGGVRLRF